MALSGSFNTNAYGNRYLTFSWTATQSTEKNESYITWYLKGAGGGTNYYMAAPFTVVIDGETVYYTETRIQLIDGKTVASGTKTIKHNNNGSRSFSVSASAAIYSFSVNVWGSGSWDLSPIPRAAQITSAPNFTDEDSPTIQYSNIAGNVVSKIEVGIGFEPTTAVIPFREVSKSGTSYTFNFTEAERKTLWNGVLNGRPDSSVYFILRSWIDGKAYDDGALKVLTIANSAPVLNPSAYDQGTVSTQITKDSSLVISGYNTMNVSTGAVAQKGATIISQSITCGDKVVNAASGLMPYVTSGTFTFSATDNRGQTTKKTIDLTLIPHFKPTINFEAKPELDGTTAKINYKISGSWYNGQLGATKNGVNVRIRYAEKGEAFNDWVIVTPTVKNNTYSIESAVLGLDYQKAHTIQASVNDVIYNDILSEEITVKTIPVFEWGENDFNFNVPTVSIENVPITDYVIETGQEAMGSNGTWYWSKWKSGKAECYGVRNYGNMGISKAWGSVYESESFTQALPSGLFISAPDFISIHPYKAGGGMWVEMGIGEPTKSQTGNFYMVRGTAATVTQVFIAFNVIGRWK